MEIIIRNIEGLRKELEENYKNWGTQNQKYFFVNVFSNDTCGAEGDNWQLSEKDDVLGITYPIEADVENTINIIADNHEIVSSDPEPEKPNNLDEMNGVTLIPVFESHNSDEAIGEVSLNMDLDRWTGSNWQNGGPGDEHRGIEAFNRGYVIIHASQQEGFKPFAVKVSRVKAVQEILKSGNTELFKKYPDLQKLRKNMSKPC